MTAAQLGSILNYPKSSLNVLLKSLTAQGYLSFDDYDVSYFPTLKITQIGEWLPMILLGSESLLPMLEDLRDRTGETVAISIASGLHMQVVRVLAGTKPIALQLTEGHLFPMFGTAVGTAYLATMADDAIAALAKRVETGKSRPPAIDLDAIRDAVARARQLGYATAYDNGLADVGAIAAAFRAKEHGQRLVIGVGGLSSRIQANKVGIVRDLQRWTRATGMKPALQLARAAA